MTSISLPGASGSFFVRSVVTCWACVAVANPKVKINTERMSFFMLCIASVLSVMCCDNRWRGPKIKKRSLGNAPFNTYFLLIVRSRNSCINDPIRSTSSSNAKWPVSRRRSSALGISLLKSSAPSTVKIPSFLPQVISVGGAVVYGNTPANRHRHPDSFLRCRGLKVGFPCSPVGPDKRSEEHTSELQSQSNLVCRLLLEKKKNPGTGCATRWL